MSSITILRVVVHVPARVRADVAENLYIFVHLFLSESEVEQIERDLPMS